MRIVVLASLLLFWLRNYAEYSSGLSQGTSRGYKPENKAANECHAVVD